MFTVEEREMILAALLYSMNRIAQYKLPLDRRLEMLRALRFLCDKIEKELPVQKG